jgi:hypothetical protein
MNGSDFPLSPAAVILNWSYDNEERLPFKSRVVGNNQLFDIDSGYTFKKNHALGETVHLMATQSSISKTGIEYPTYLVGTAEIRNQILNLLNRIKAAGIRLTLRVV